MSICRVVASAFEMMSLIIEICMDDFLETFMVGHLDMLLFVNPFDTLLVAFYYLIFAACGILSTSDLDIVGVERIP